MIKFLLWVFLFLLCWPLALLALIAYPVIWLLLLPFRLIGIASMQFLSCYTAFSCCPSDFWAAAHISPITPRDILY